MKNSSSILSHVFVKPFVAGISSAIADHFILKNTDMQSNLMFGGAVGGGIFISSSAGQLLSPLFPTHTPIGALGKNLEARIIEVSFGSASAYALNYFVLKNEYNTRNLLYKVGIIAASDVLGECVCEFLQLV